MPVGGGGASRSRRPPSALHVLGATLAAIAAGGSTSRDRGDGDGLSRGGRVRDGDTARRAPGGELPGKDSNLEFQGQNLASCRLLHPARALARIAIPPLAPRSAAPPGRGTVPPAFDARPPSVEPRKPAPRAGVLALVGVPRPARSRAVRRVRHASPMTVRVRGAHGTATAWAEALTPGRRSSSRRAHCPPHRNQRSDPGGPR